MRVIIFLFATLLASTAQATPPQIVGVRETLLGINATHLFVLRRMDDNMGAHAPIQTDVVLIARDRASNTDAQIWPVMRMIDNGASFADYGFETRVEVLPLKDRVNPFDILLSHKARPLLAAEPSAGVPIVRREDEVKLISKNARFLLLDKTVAQRFTSSLNATRSALPAYFIEGRERGRDILRDVQIDPAQDCEYGDFHAFFEYIGKDHTEFWISRVTCENDDIMAEVSMYFLIPKAP